MCKKIETPYKYSDGSNVCIGDKMEFTENIRKINSSEFEPVKRTGEVLLKQYEDGECCGDNFHYGIVVEYEAENNDRFYTKRKTLPDVCIFETVSVKKIS